MTLNEERSSPATVLMSMSWIQQDGVRILAAVSSLQACGGIPSSTMLTRYLSVANSAWPSLDQGRMTSAVVPIGSGEVPSTRSLTA